MLAVIRHQIHQGETIVGRDEIHAGLDAPPLRGIEVWRADDTLFHVAQNCGIALQETANTVAELTVPLCPAAPRRE